MAKTAGVAALSNRIGHAVGSALSRRDARGLARQALFLAAWGAAAVFLGMVVGYASIAFPPAGTFGAVAGVGAILLWVAPDVRAVSDKTVRRFLFISLAVFLCVPGYYALILPALPQVSIRRIAAVPLICLYLLYLSTSAQARAHLVSVMRDARPIFIGAVGFQVMIFLSVFTSINPLGSLSQGSDALLIWLIPLLAVASVIKTDRDVNILLRVICVSAVFVGALGFADFLLKRNLMVDILPQSVFQNLMQDRSFSLMVLTPSYRDGMYRASSVYGVPLSFGEFEAMIFSLGAFFLLQGRGFVDRFLGVAVIVTSLLGVLSAGSRGGYISSFVAWAVFAALWIARDGKFKPGSLLAPMLATIAAVFFALLLGLLMVSQRAYNMVYGGGLDQGRSDQMQMAIPHILSNPVTGHGFSMGAEILGWGAAADRLFSIDSYPLSLLVETGVPSLVFFVTIIGGALWISVRTCLVDASPRGAMNAAFVASLAAFTMNRLVLSERENHTLFFVICGIIAASTALSRRSPGTANGATSRVHGAGRNDERLRGAKSTPKKQD